jgi:hypothetical protein
MDDDDEIVQRVGDALIDAFFAFGTFAGVYIWYMTCW